MPFYSISGSDFVEMFVGVGASRVRDLFNQAKESSPAIIFIDEIDAVGRHRGAGMGGGHDEREQTLNQMLVEMDGFDPKVNVIVIAATNRPDILDPALLRPGRFDRQIRRRRTRPQGTPAHPRGARSRQAPVGLGRPRGRRAQDARFHRCRPGQRPQRGGAADGPLERAADRQPRPRRAIDRVIAGPQRRTRVMKDKEKLITAYHEGGHALAAAGDEPHRPGHQGHHPSARQGAGYTMVLPLDDKYSVTRNELQDQLTYAMGGRVAEEIVFHDPTTGASNDIEKATSIARKMVTSTA